MAILVFIGLTGLQTASVLPGDTLMPVIGGFLFGPVAGSAYTVMGSTVGATLAFVASRYLLQQWVQQRAGARVQRLEKGFSRYGFHYLLTLRLAPLLPSFVVNFGAGLTHVSLQTYVLSTMVGILPSTIAYAAATRHLESVDSFGDLGSPTVFWSLVGVALIALVPAIYGSVRSHR